MNEITRILEESGYDESGMTLSFIFSSKALWYASVLQKGLVENKLPLCEVKRLLDNIRCAELQFIGDEDFT